MKKLIGLLVVAVLFSATISAQATQKVEKKATTTVKQAAPAAKVAVAEKKETKKAEATEKVADKKAAVAEKKEVKKAKAHKAAHKAKKAAKMADTTVK